MPFLHEDDRLGAHQAGQPPNPWTRFLVRADHHGREIEREMAKIDCKRIDALNR